MAISSFQFKGCTKCKGDLHLEEDQYGAFLRCMQCGQFTDITPQEPFRGLKPRTSKISETLARSSKVMAA